MCVCMRTCVCICMCSGRGEVEGATNLYKSLRDPRTERELKMSVGNDFISVSL